MDTFQYIGRPFDKILHGRGGGSGGNSIEENDTIVYNYNNGIISAINNLANTSEYVKKVNILYVSKISAAPRVYP